ncbi:MAG: DNRLRE domain-containing protein [Planctomycetes bacterium]|nr:DNRLRE domain-containing protein [Planctomycetota bacterium]
MLFRNRWCIVALVAAAMTAGAAYAANVTIFDDFESYAEGTGTFGKGIWTTWGDDPAADGVVSTEQASSGTKSLKISGDNDVVGRLNQAKGACEFSVKVFVPADHAGSTYVILMSSYGAQNVWACQIEIKGTDTITETIRGANSLPLVTGAWSEIKVVIDLVANTKAVFYNGAALVAQAQYTDNGPVAVAVLDLYGGDDGSPVYFDDVKLVDTTPKPVWNGVQSGVGDRFNDDVGFRGASAALDGFEPGMVVSGAGGDIWSDWDSFYYVHHGTVKVSGDFDAQVKIESFTKEGGGDPCWWGRAGFMVREHTGNGSPYAFAGINGGRQVLSYSRQDNGANFWGDTGDAGGGNQDQKTLPIWMRLTRTGNTYRFFWKQNEGDAWIQLREHPRAWTPATMLLGYAVQNHNDCWGDPPALGKFSHLAITDSTGTVTLPPDLSPVGVYGGAVRTLPTGVYANWKASPATAYFVAERTQNGVTEDLQLPGHMREVIDDSAGVGLVTYRLTAYDGLGREGGNALMPLWTNGVDSNGYVMQWNITPHLGQPYGWWPAVSDARKDYLTDGAGITEANILPIPGTTVNTNFNGAAASTGCTCGWWKAGCFCNPVTFMYQPARVDGYFDYNDIFGDIDDVMTYMVAYITNTTDADQGLFFEFNSDDSMVIMIDNTVWNIYQGCCYGTGLGLLTPGEHRLMLKVFEGGGGHNARLRILNTQTMQPFPTGDLIISAYPASMTSVPGPLPEPQGISTSGFVTDWLLLGQYREPYGCGPSTNDMLKDYLTEGAGGTQKTEENIVPVQGMKVYTDYGAAASTSCERGTAPEATCDPLTVFAVHRDDGYVDFNGVFGDQDNLMTYMFAYVTNHTDAHVLVQLGTGSDDSIAVKLDNFVWQAVSACRGHVANNDTTIMSIPPGTHRLMAKVFEGGGGFGASVRLRDWETRGPVTPGTLTISTTPPDGFVVPPAPACISGLAGAITAQGIKLTWDSSQIYDRYVIERKPVLERDWTVLADDVDGAATSYLDAEPIAGTAAAHYRVTPVYDIGPIAYPVCQALAGVASPGYVIYQEGVFPTAAYTGTQDTHIIINTSNSNQGSSPLFEEGDWNAPDGYDHKEALLSFELAPLPEGKEVQKATLGVFFDSSRNGVYNDHTVYIRQVMKQWNQGTGCCSDGPDAKTGEASWNAARQNQENWEIPGAYGSTDIAAASPEVSAVFGAVSQRWVTFGGEGLKNIIDTWFYEIFPNYGFKITQCEGVDACKPGAANTYIRGAYDFCSSEHPDASRRPILIMYTNRAPTVTVTPAGPLSAELCDATVSFDLSARARDADGDPLTIVWTATGGEVTAGEPPTTARAVFDAVGEYVVTCTVSDGVETTSKDVVIVVTECSGVSLYIGDANCSKAIDLADAVCILGYLFGPETDACKNPCCLAQMDTNNSDSVDLSDAIRVLSYLFAGGNMQGPDGSSILPANSGCLLYPQPTVTLPCARSCPDY